MSAERYLLCRAGSYPIAIPALTVLHVWRTDLAAPERAYAAEPVDLRLLLDGVSTEPRVARRSRNAPMRLACCC